MNEEEKESFKFLKDVCKAGFNSRILGSYDLKNILNIIEKQQDEIESYKERYENMKWYFDNQKNNLIHKNRIKEKIKLLKDIKKAYCYKQLTEDYLKGAIEQLEELLANGQESDQEGGQEDE